MEALGHRPWQKLRMREGNDAMSSNRFMLAKMDTTRGLPYRMAVTDLRAVYFREVDRDQFQAEKEEIGLSGDDASVLDAMRDLLLGGEVWWVPTGDAEVQHLQVSKSLANGVSLVWQVSCPLWNGCSAAEAVEHYLLRPTLRMLAVAVTQTEQLVNVVAKKDVELELRKTTAASAIRQSQVTRPFNVDRFVQRSVKSREVRAAWDLGVAGPSQTLEVTWRTLFGVIEDTPNPNLSPTSESVSSRQNPLSGPIVHVKPKDEDTQTFPSSSQSKPTEMIPPGPASSVSDLWAGADRQYPLETQSGIFHNATDRGVKRAKKPSLW
mmetsp:Transcript_1706/g.3151  ORF Transcript_1706/g.3151 Transcript_1706/m.3151 type:complete len:322 (+) Transcript_1706:1996-2961(+)